MLCKANPSLPGQRIPLTLLLTAHVSYIHGRKPACSLSEISLQFHMANGLAYTVYIPRHRNIHEAGLTDDMFRAIYFLNRIPYIRLLTVLAL